MSVYIWNTKHHKCNCRNKQKCPLEEKCLQTNVVYQATVMTEIGTKTFVGLATNFKERVRNHQKSFRNAHKRNETELLKHIDSKTTVSDTMENT